ncbi:hypothetical protein AB751O23_BA_00080 [Chlamydiales bacterium SCGC AB-751-O23]|nr:hypothetical protein AB751O23_BA_00080 [Chlamydiales bacterium SCGC AB-751-O23]
MFILSSIYFFKEVIPNVTPRDAEEHIATSRRFTQKWITAKHPLLAVAIGITGTAIFIYTLKKEYWSDPKYIHEQRVDFLQNTQDFADLFEDCSHLDKLLQYGCVSAQELRNKIESKLSHASHLEFVEWVLCLNMEDLIAYKNQGVLDSSLFIDFSIGRSPLVFLDLISILDSSYWVIFFSKLIHSKILTIESFQSKLSTELAPFQTYSDLIRKIAWKKLKILLENQWLPPENLQTVTQKSNINDIKLLLQEETLSEIMASGAFQPKQLSNIVKKEFALFNNLYDAFRSLPFPILMKFHDQGLLEKQLFQDKFNSCSPENFRLLMTSLSLQELKELLEKNLISTKTLKEKVLIDSERAANMQEFINIYGLDALVFFLEEGILDPEVSKHLSKSSNFSYNHLFSALQPQSPGSIKLLNQLVHYKIISQEKLKQQISSVLLSVNAGKTLLKSFNFSFIKELIRSNLLEGSSLSKHFLTELQNQGLINFVLEHNWQFSDFELVFLKETSAVLNEAFVISLGVYSNFLCFRQSL